MFFLPQNSLKYSRFICLSLYVKIVLYTGGIADYNLSYEIISTIETWPENVVLVMHCFGTKEAIEELKNFACRFKGEIYFSTEMVPFSEINKLYSSCDIGFAMYGNHDLNHKYFENSKVLHRREV